MKTVRLLALAAWAVTLAFAGYTYDYAGLLNPYSASQWTGNGSYSASTGMFTSSASNGGSLILNAAVPSTPNDYEVRTTLTLASSGGTYITYLGATSNALAASGNTGTWYAVEIANPTFSGGGCIATINFLKSLSGTVTNLYSGGISCHSGMVVRAIKSQYDVIIVYIDNAVYGGVSDSSIYSGQPGIGVLSAPSGNGISTVDIGHNDTVAPNPINGQSIGTSIFSNRVDIQWQGTLDDANGTGIAFYELYRNGSWLGVTPTQSPEFSDTTVQTGTNYTYALYAVDFHWNSTATSITVTTPPTGSIDPRQVGVRSTGTYWGGGGEQIDMRSGNLNYTVPLIKALGRGGWSVGFSLNYNSQNWRQDPGGTWQLGRDVGYGYGWKLLAGSLTPYYSGWFTLDHYVFTDSTGTEYRLTQNNSGVWSSTEGIYVWFDSNTNELHFKDGSFWTMGAISAGTEQDSGTMYPTLMEDTNGNQVTINYDDGAGVTWANSSARILKVIDLRSAYYSFLFSYSQTGGVSHLSTITDEVGTAQSYSFSIATGQPLNSPFDGTSYGATSWAFLNSLTQTGTNLTTSLTYDSGHSGELDQVTTPYAGHLRWQYVAIKLGGTRWLREVQNRYLAMSSGATERQYTMARVDDSSLTVHSSAEWSDVTGNAEKFWQFQTTGTQFNVGMATSYEERQLPSHTALTHTDYTWSQDPGGNPYISASLTKLDPTQSYAVQKKTTQTLDQYGNVTQTQDYDFGTPGSNLPLLRTYTNTYLTSYPSQYIFNRLLTSTVQNSGATQTATLVSNTYDQATLTNNVNLGNHDASYGTSFTSRGNLTTSVTPSGTSTMTYDIGGNLLSTTANGVTTTSTVNGATYYSAPSALTTNSLTTTINWTSFLGLSSQTGPNGDSSSIGYDSNARPSSTTSPYGAVTNYAYFDTASPPYKTATINGRVTTTTMDGFGRAIKTVQSSGSTTYSTVDAVYDACGCSPLGKLMKQSQPYAPGQTEYWTTYTYDALGRTTAVTAPDGSVTTYGYGANTVRVTDPAGKWKWFAMDVFGNVAQVAEPDPTLGTVGTYYTYDILNHLTQVSMPRGSTTQTRTFNYATGSTVGPYLLSATNPENGTVTYTYGGGLLATKTDARGVQLNYSYDGYRRLTQVSVGTSNPSVLRTYYYDTNPLDSTGTFSQNASGRLTAVQYATVEAGVIQGEQSAIQLTDMYSYTQPGGVGTKRLQVSESLSWQDTYGYAHGATPVLNFDLGYTYNNEGRVASVTYPTTSNSSLYYPTGGPPQGVPIGAGTGTTYNYTFDNMGRLGGMTDAGGGTDVSGVTYGPSNELLGMSYFGLTESRTYNSRLQLTGISVNQQSYPQTLLTSLTYTYPTNGTNNGKISQQTDNMSGETVQYIYDSLNRLIQGQATSGSWGQGFTYDPFGNLTAKTVTAGSAPSLTQAVDPTTNRISGANYDANGNALGGVAGSYGQYAYDAENRVTLVYNMGSNGNMMYDYDARNKRFWSWYTGWTDPEGFGNADGWAVAIYSPSGQKLETIQMNVLNTGTDSRYPALALASTLISSDAYFGRRRLAAQDRLGSVGKYYPYGEDKGTSNPTGDTWKFGTYWRDSFSGLDYADQRYYNNAMGRFMSPDPYKASGGTGDPQSWNRFAYVGNDPINFYDPYGTYKACPPNTVTGPDGTTCVPTNGGQTSGSGFDPTSFPGLYGQTYTPQPQTPSGPNPSTLKSLRCAADKALGVPDGRTIGLNGAIGVLGGVAGSAEIVFDYHTGQATLVLSGGFGPSGAVGQVGVSTGFIYGGPGSGSAAVSNYASGGNTTVSASIPSGLGVSATSNSGGINGNPFNLNTFAATALQVGYSAGLVSLLGGFSAVAQNTILQVPLGSFITGPASVLSALEGPGIEGLDDFFAILQNGCS